MTLILAFCDRQGAIQVSDRRLTGFVGGNPIYVDQTNKAVLVCDRCSVAYTGLARLGDKPTSEPVDEWITSILAKRNVWDFFGACKALKEEATSTFNTLDIHQRHKRIAFALSGYTFDESKTAIPLIGCVSNFFHLSDEPFNTGRSEPEPAFDLWATAVTLPPEGTFLLKSFGYLIPQGQFAEVYRDLERGLSSGWSRFQIADLLVRTILTISKSNPTVGGQLNIVSIPRPDYRVGGSYIAVSTTPTGLRRVECFSFPQTDPQYGPNFVCGGSSMISTSTSL